MSKYTTQVRFICESKGGYDESVGGDKINEVLDRSWNKIFTSDVPFFDESYRSLLCKKILKHYYMREIGAETVGLWTFWMNTRLEEIMPYYNKLYESANIEFNPIFDVDITRSHEGKGNKTSEKETDNLTEGSGNAKTDVHSITEINNHQNGKTNEQNLYSDTPQGGISQIANMQYLTNATINDISSKNDTTGDSETSNEVTNEYSDKTILSGKENDTVNTSEKYIERVTGKQGSGSYSEMINEYRTTLLNIDMMVINDFNDLFMLIW